MTPELRRQAYDWIHRMENTFEASESWFETSCSSLPQYWVCDGNQLLNWKDRGYVTVFDLLQVNLIDKHLIFEIDLSRLNQLLKYFLFLFLAEQNTSKCKQ